MNPKKEIKQIIAARYVEFSGYKNKAIKKTRFKKQITGWLFSFAPIIVMSIFIFGSFIIGLLLINYNGKLDASMSNISYVGFKNFSLISKDTLLLPAIKNSLLFMSITTVVGIFGALVIAFLVNSGKIIGKKVFLIGYFLPQITSMVAGAIIFAQIFGSKGALSFSDHPERAIWIIIISGLWVQMAGIIVNFNTAFSSLSQTEYEAAELDGAKSLNKFFKITIPALMPIIVYQILMGIIVGMVVFGQSYIILQLQYVNTPKYIITWATLGFMRIIGNNQGLATNVGLGMIELLFLGLTILLISLIANRIQPISGKKGGK